MKTGEVKEFQLPARDDRPGGAHNAKFDQFGNIWVAQLWSGQFSRFDTNVEKPTGVWAVPIEWTRTTGVVVCPTLSHPKGPIWVNDGFSGKNWTLNPETGKLTEVQNARWSVCDNEGNLYGMQPGFIRKTEPDLVKFTDYKTPTPKAMANENRLNVDSAGNIWYGDWGDGHIAYLNVKTGKITEFSIPSPWALAYNAIGDGKNNVGWSVPHMSDRMVKADAKTGEVTEFPLPSNGYQIRNLGIELTANPPAIWFPSQQDGTVVRFQEFTE
jgi:streptogramin lyase